MADNVSARKELKSWFSNGKKPNENHLAAIFDSYVDKTDTIPADRIEDLDQILRLNTGLTPRGGGGPHRLPQRIAHRP